MGDWELAVVLALVAQVGLFAMSWVQQRKSRVDRAAQAVSVLHDVNDELRVELARVAGDRDDGVARLTDQIAELSAQLRLAREEARGAHETAGRCLRRVDYLESVLRAQGIRFDPGPVD